MDLNEQLEQTLKAIALKRAAALVEKQFREIADILEYQRRGAGTYDPIHERTRMMHGEMHKAQTSIIEKLSIPILEQLRTAAVGRVAAELSKLEAEQP